MHINQMSLLESDLHGDLLDRNLWTLWLSKRYSRSSLPSSRSVETGISLSLSRKIATNATTQPPSWLLFRQNDGNHVQTSETTPNGPKHIKGTE